MKTEAKMGKTVQKATVCLYGAPHCGYGYLATARPEALTWPKAKPDPFTGRTAEMINGKLVADGSLMFGDGEPAEHRGIGMAYMLAMCNLTDAGLPSGSEVTVFMPGGERMARATLGRAGYFGDLKWEPATVYVISGEALTAASGKV